MFESIHDFGKWCFCNAARPGFSLSLALAIFCVSARDKIAQYRAGGNKPKIEVSEQFANLPDTSKEVWNMGINEEARQRGVYNVSSY